MNRTLSQIFNDLSFGSLSGYSISIDGTGDIVAAKKPRVINLINQGLLELYTRYVLREKELKIRYIEGRTLYPLLVKHADVAGDDAVRFIVDSAEEPFVQDVIRVTSAMYDDDTEAPLNDEKDPLSIFTPMTGVIQIPVETECEDSEIIRISYQARHPLIGVDDDAQVIWLPEALYPALDRFVASRLLMSMNGAEHRQRGADFLAEFEAICGRSRDEDTAQTSHVTTTYKLDERGFV